MEERRVPGDRREVVPCHNLDAERALLGAILLDHEAFETAAAVVQAVSFYRKAHQQIFAGMEDLAHAHVPIDLPILRDKLRDKGALESVGGATYLSGLVDGMPHGANVEYYARIVEEKATLRKIQGLAATLLQEVAESEQSALEILANVDAKILALTAGQISGDLEPASALMARLYPVIEEAYRTKRAITGLQTAWRELDELTLGLHPGTLIYLAGQTSQGKSSLGLNLAVDIARQGHPVAVFSLEDSKDSIGLRAIAARSGVSLFRLRSGYLNDPDWTPLSDAFSAISNAKLWIDDTAAITPQAVRAKCRRLQSMHGLSLVVVDYVQLMAAPGKFENRTREVSAVSAALKQIAKELQIPLVVCSQLSRDPAKEVRRPRLSDLRESGSLEQDADLVLLIYRPEQQNQTPDNEGLAELIIAKQKNGPTGTVKLRFRKETFRFETWQDADLLSARREWSV
jgi:replicative DNA helicase